MRLALGEQGLEDGAVAVVAHQIGPLMASGEAQSTHVVAGSVRWAGLRPFLLVPSGLMKKLPHEPQVKTSASSSADSVASLSEQRTRTKSRT